MRERSRTEASGGVALIQTVRHVREYSLFPDLVPAVMLAMGVVLLVLFQLVVSQVLVTGEEAFPVVSVWKITGVYIDMKGK